MRQEYIYKKIGKIVFGMLSPKLIKKIASTKIVTAELYDKEGYPVDGGLMDIHLGVIDPGLRCKTCSGKLKECPGHFGYVELARPVVHVKYVRKILVLLKATCKECGHILALQKDIQDKNLKGLSLLKYLITVKTCPHCNTKQIPTKFEKPSNFFEDEKRLGQPTRIQELLRRFNSDYLVLMDADLIIKDIDGIQRLIKKIAADRNIGLAAAHMRPTSPKTFLESAINNYRYAREYIEKDFSFGKKVWGAHGCLVYSKSFGKSLYIPKHILSVDSFSYYSCLKQGYKHEYANDAIVLYRSPQTLQDHMSQATRHYTGGFQLYDFFEKNMIESEQYVPISINLKLMLYQFLHNPLGYIFLKLVNTYCLYKSKQTILHADSKWRVVLSTKRI